MMKVDFDPDLAFLAIETGAGRVETKTGLPVTITNFVGDNPEYPLEGEIIYPGYFHLDKWNLEGKHIYHSELDLIIAVLDEE